MTDHTHQNDPARSASEKAIVDWREAVAKKVAAWEALDLAPAGDAHAEAEQAHDAAEERCKEVARLAWSRLSVPADVRVRAEIARHCLWPAYHGERRFEAVLGGEEFNDGLELAEFDERAVAELVKGVLWTASAAPARGHGEPAPGERPRMPQLTDKDLDDDDDVIPVPMPEEASMMVDDAKAAIDAARVLWTSNNLDDRSPDRRVTESFWTCIDTAERELKRLTELIDAATERAVDAWHKSTPPTQAVIDAWGKSRTTTCGQFAEAQASSVPGSGNSEGRTVYDLEDLVGRARDGVTALWNLWGSHCTSPEEFPDQKFAASLKFCIDGIDTLLEQADQQIEAAIEGRRSPD